MISQCTIQRANGELLLNDDDLADHNQGQCFRPPLSAAHLMYTHLIIIKFNFHCEWLQDCCPAIDILKRVLGQWQWYFQP
jgi:hypothetical protein